MTDVGCNVVSSNKTCHVEVRTMGKGSPQKTPDGRYIVVRGRLWRTSNPAISGQRRQQLVDELMEARRAVRDAGEDRDALAEARLRVNDAKVALGERGPVWWDDGAPDYNRHLMKNTPYANASLS